MEVGIVESTAYMFFLAYVRSVVQMNFEIFIKSCLLKQYILKNEGSVMLLKIVLNYRGPILELYKLYLSCSSLNFHDIARILIVCYVTVNSVSFYYVGSSSIFYVEQGHRKNCESSVMFLFFAILLSVRWSHLCSCAIYSVPIGETAGIQLFF